MELPWRSIWRYSVAGFILSLTAGMQPAESTYASTVADDRTLFEQAVRLSKAGDWRKAAGLFRDIAGRNPSWPEPKNNLAVAMLQIGQLEQAQQALEEAVSSQPSFRTAQANRSRLYDYLAARAYHKAIGEGEANRPPRLDLLTRIAAPQASVPASPQKTAPVKPTAPIRSLGSSMDASEQIRQGLLGWSQAWEKADVDAYLSAYSRDFTPEDPGKDYNEWSNIRRARLKLASNTRIKLNNIRVYVDPDRNEAIAEFVQSYHSDTYHDRVIKQLRMALQNDRWLIMTERVIEKLN